MGKIFADSLYDAIIDSLKILPILFLAYLLVSLLSHDHRHKFSNFLTKKNSPLFGAFLGCVPQCGFSSVIAEFYAHGSVTLGTLIAVFVATSDEAIPIMLSSPSKILDMLVLIGVKVLLAVFWGYAIDLTILAIKKKKRLQSGTHSDSVLSHEAESAGHEPHVANMVHAEKELKSDAVNEHDGHCDEHHEGHYHECGHIHTQYCADDCGHEHGNCCVNNVFLDAFLHTFYILIYIFVATFLLSFAYGCIKEFGGEAAIQTLLNTNVFLQIVLAGLIGLFPNCASSVLLVQCYIGVDFQGQMVPILSFPALIAGLTAGAGVGLVILFTKNKKHMLTNVGIMVLQYFIGIISGLACLGIMLACGIAV